MKILKKTFLCTVMFFSIFIFASFAGGQKDARPGKDGWLSVEGSQIVNENGEAVTLRGISTHGLTWYPDYINDKLFSQISTEWNCNFVRLPMYSADYVKNKKENLKILHRGIEAAIKSDMYVLVDWHILTDNNPLDHLKQAEKFFDDISAEYANSPNIIYEICNEPNGNTTWDDIYEYANQIIPIIRKNSPNSIIVVGTPDYDQDLESPKKKPLDFDNVMYVFHFYTASHYDEMFEKLEAAHKANLPVFISECGITEADGNGLIDYGNAVKWFNYLHENNISYVIWNLSNKNESSSFIKATTGEDKHLTDDDLTDSGKWVKALIQGQDPKKIKKGATQIKYSVWDYFSIQIHALGDEGLAAVNNWWKIALVAVVVFLIILFNYIMTHVLSRMKLRTYDDLIALCNKVKMPAKELASYYLKKAVISISLFLTFIYLCWRLLYSINTGAGVLAIVCNVLLLIVETLGFVESCIHYRNIANLKNHPLPEIEDDEYPEVDIFIASYNEPAELLRKTINGCKHLKYPDKSKVHIWLCDDNRRAYMRELAESMGIGYFDRPDNKGAKAGNLNNALKQTSAPYVVTLDADMIVKSDFLLKTIPYFVYVEKCNQNVKENQKRHLGLLQSPQCFYDADVFQHALYSENNIPNEQDFFYRSIEVGKTTTNSVIYGGSNTVLSRQALLDIGGFYTETITEDFATGLLIESAGYLSLGIPEPLASGQTPHTFKEHIKQRTRWGRGVINTAKKLKIFRRKELNLSQKLSYWSSYIYWFSPVKNFIYVLSPLMFATFMIPVFKCNWLELLVFWLPMFVFQDICLRFVGGNKTSLKWSCIYEMSVMPYLLIPIIKESIGISLKKFQVTDKSGKGAKKKEKNLKTMMPFIILIILSVFGIFRVIYILKADNSFGMVVILFWLIRNLYGMIMVLFLINGRNSNTDEETVIVKDGEMVSVKKIENDIISRNSYKRKYDQDDNENSEAPVVHDGITSRLTEHNVQIFLDEGNDIRIGDMAELTIMSKEIQLTVKGVVTKEVHLNHSNHYMITIEILDFGSEENEFEYLEILYDRVPTLPQSLKKDFGILSLLWRNIVCRVARRI